MTSCKLSPGMMRMIPKYKEIMGSEGIWMYERKWRKVVNGEPTKPLTVHEVAVLIKSRIIGNVHCIAFNARDVSLLARSRNFLMPSFRLQYVSQFDGILGVRWATLFVLNNAYRRPDFYPIVDRIRQELTINHASFAIYHVNINGEEVHSNLFSI